MASAEYLDRAIEGFDRDPPDTDFQRGYLEALKAVRAEAIPAPRDDDFARVVQTELGQLLVYLDTDDDENGYLIVVVGAPVRGVTAKVKLGYPDEQSRYLNFAKVIEDAEKVAATLHGTAESLAA